MDGANADVNMAQVRDLQASLFPICMKGTNIIIKFFFFSINNKRRVNNYNEYNDYDVSEHTRVCANDEYTNDSAIIILFSRKTFF